MSVGTNIRLSEFWDAIIMRLSEASMLTRLGATAAKPRIYLADEDYSNAEGEENLPWYRLVIVPTNPAEAQIDDPTRPRRIAWLIRAEANNFRQRGYSVAVALEAIHSEAWRLLTNWAPPVIGFQGVVVALPVYRWTPPQPLPLYDDGRALWYNSAEYRTDVVAP